ncbi:MAG: helix-turn-helix domain-containing protein [Bacteroidetes bacterium]|nr:helix-turn-helix domain-containing protein [Bacteroidota bacterium]
MTQTLSTLAASSGGWGASFPAPITASSLRNSPLVQIPAAFLDALMERVDTLASLVRDLHGRGEAKPDLDAKARYRLDEAAAYLGTSASTLKRRAHRGKFVILYDGKTPFVTGAEVLRYAREGAKRRTFRKPCRAVSTSAD